ncbi:PH domain-containing protein [Lactiplantibacillus plantarum]|uniref:PH domain-containing protein n=1 Tax=Lactiplantibacillus plantarum TaxID=1590 RepID=UPI00223810D3|nr:PH domain-containing protein [Lactiplantibacillus plantarum]MCW6172462.1 PH domain-containing protein [Lactiplantibacillus plantarum]
MDLDTVKSQMEQAGVSDLFGTKKEVKALPEILNDDEHIVYATSGVVDSSTVLAVLTQKRVIFIDKGLIYGIKSTEVPLDMINGVSYSKGIMLGKISITNGAVTTVIDDVDKSTAPIMAEKIKATAEQYKQGLRTPVSSSPKPVLDGPDQIRKYKSLADDGIITQEEFEAKKKQILGI